MNEGLELLEPYPFEKLAIIRADSATPTAKTPIDLSIGEPKHATPRFITASMEAHLQQASRYPPTRGSPELREAIAAWLCQRYGLDNAALDPELHVLPVNGTREALFAAAQFIIDRRAARPLVVMPNPCYQIYEGAALLAGAKPHYVACTSATAYRPRFESVPEAVWRNCQLLYLCSPGNPTGAVAAPADIEILLELAEVHDFIIAADECYSEIYLDDASPPSGLLEIAARTGRSDFHNCMVFHSLSKRSNVPGMRSGFVAGDASLIREFLRYRTYHGCAMAPYVQAASRVAWLDEEHVRENRALYREKFDAVLNILAPVLRITPPDGSFYLWPSLPVDDVDFARSLLASQNVCVIPGSFLGRRIDGVNPGAGHVRIALVAELDVCVEAAHRIREFAAAL